MLLQRHGTRDRFYSSSGNTACEHSKVTKESKKKRCLRSGHVIRTRCRHAHLLDGPCLYVRIIVRINWIQHNRGVFDRLCLSQDSKTLTYYTVPVLSPVPRTLVRKAEMLGFPEFSVMLVYRISRIRGAGPLQAAGATHPRSSRTRARAGRGA